MNQRKASIDEIRQRFDNDVERFSNQETGQTAAIDSRLCMDLIAQAAAATTPGAARLLDVGCGAGNYSLAILERLPRLEITLIDLSQPMLDRARQRVAAAGAAAVTLLQTDVRQADLGSKQFDLIVAAAVLHHLRSEEEWIEVFRNFYRSLTIGGSLWIFDLVDAPTSALHDLTWQAYGEYLSALGGDVLRERVLQYVEYEDTPRPLVQQLDWLRAAGFVSLEVLHKRCCFAAFGGLKPRS